MSDTTDIQKFCKEKNILFIEDAAQSFGSSLNNIPAGTIGDCSVYSFNSNKVVAGINGGGVFLTDDESVAKRVKLIRRHGKDQDFSMLGFNSRMYVLNAQIINLRLQNAERNQSRRQEIARIYNDAFIDLPVITQGMSPGLNHNYHKYVMRFKDMHTRNRVKNALRASVHYEMPLSENSMYNGLVHRKDNCVNSIIAANTVLSLPVHAWMTKEETSNIIDTVRKEFL
jgi:dTDP-4-amino-4,6-dideoxygalactose transaminase